MSDKEQVCFIKTDYCTVEVIERPVEDDPEDRDVTVELCNPENGTYVVFALDEIYEFIHPLMQVISYSKLRYLPQDQPVNLFEFM